MLYIKSSRPRSPNSLHKHDVREELERLGLARRLHETLAQDLAAIGYQLDAVIAEQDLKQNQRDDIRSIRLEVMRVAREFRDEIYRLRTMGRNELQGRILAELSTQNVEIDLTYPALQPQAEQSLNEVIMEIARNTAKHSNAERFYLRYVMHENELEILIGDDGLGKIDIKKNSFGLRGIDEVLKGLAREYSCTSDYEGTHFRIILELSMLAS